MLNVEADGLQQQKTTMGTAPVSCIHGRLELGCGYPSGIKKKPTRAKTHYGVAPSTNGIKSQSKGVSLPQLD